MERREDEAGRGPGPEPDADEETHEDAGLPGGGGAVAPPAPDDEG